MAAEQETPFRLDNEQRARVRDCLRKEALSLPRDRLERLIGGIEASIARFRATPPEGSFRDAHDTLRALRALADEDIGAAICSPGLTLPSAGRPASRRDDRGISR